MDMTIIQLRDKLNRIIEQGGGNYSLTMRTLQGNAKVSGLAVATSALSPKEFILMDNETKEYTYLDLI